VGGELNAFTGKEDTIIHATILKNDLKKALELIAEMTFNATFPAKEAEKEKPVIVDEINFYKDNPVDQIFDDFEEHLFAHEAIGRPILGNATSLLSITPPQLHRFVDRHYFPQNMVLSIVGKCPGKRIEQLAGQYFGAFEGNGKQCNRSCPGAYTPFKLQHQRNTYQAHCILGNRAYPFYHPRYMALALFVNYLGGPASNSLFNTLLREKYGWVYSVEVNYTPYSDCGGLTIYFGTDKKRVEDCQEIIFKELEKLRKTPFTGIQLHRMKKQMLGQLAIAADNAESQMISQAKSVLAFDTIETSEQIKEKIDHITSAELQDIVEELFHPANLSCLIYV
jgi:predicted Zn-dependent peptidase